VKHNVKSEGTALSKRHDTNKQSHVWLREEDFEKVKQFLDKFSAGESFSEQASALTIFDPQKLFRGFRAD
jgi:hypothetical protein